MKKKKTALRKSGTNNCQASDDKPDNLITRIIPKKKLPLLLRQIECIHEETVTKHKQYPYPCSENKRNKTVIIRIPQDIENELQNLVRKGEAVAAMKQIINLTGIGLKVAKDYIESLL